MTRRVISPARAQLSKDLISVTSRDFVITGIISIAAIFILIAICFKSISIPVILVASIELAILINEACSLITGAEIPFIAPTIISCVQLGATVDYAILMTSRYKERAQQRQRQDRRHKGRRKGLQPLDIPERARLLLRDVRCVSHLQCQHCQEHMRQLAERRGHKRNNHHGVQLAAAVPV